jgi:hypothetical protein
MDPQVVKQSFEYFSDVWRSIDLPEVELLEDAISKAGPIGSVDHLLLKIRSCWPSETPRDTSDHKNGNNYTLPYCELSPHEFLPFIRNVERLAIDEKLASIVIYWSRYTAARLLPGGQQYRELRPNASRISIFSGDIHEPPDEWCFLLESADICLIVYGQQMLRG